MNDPDVCVFCGTFGCLDDAADHTIECPFTTGLWPVDEIDLERGATCAACEEPMRAGDHWVEVTDDTNPLAAEVGAAWGGAPATFGVCVPCGAMGAEVKR